MTQALALFTGAAMLIGVCAGVIAWMAREVGWKMLLSVYGGIFAVMGALFLAATLINYGLTGEWVS